MVAVGTLTLVGHAWTSSGTGAGETCAGRAPFADVHNGTHVDVTDGKTTLAVIPLDRATVTPAGQGLPAQCVMQFAGAVPRGHSVYTIVLGTHVRRTASESDIDAHVIELTLGGE